MQAELTDGTIITLAKDCECITHDGPCWLHNDALWKDRNKALLRDPFNWLAQMAFVREEDIRLKEKLANFEKYGIVRLIAEW